MKALPKRIKILGQTWTIKYVPELHADADDDKVSGLSDGDGRVISICTTTNTTEAAVRSTLLHELCHSVLFVAGLRNILDTKLEEAIVVALEHGLAPLLTLK